MISDNFLRKKPFLSSLSNFLTRDSFSKLHYHIAVSRPPSDSNTFSYNAEVPSKRSRSQSKPTVNGWSACSMLATFRSDSFPKLDRPRSFWKLGSCVERQLDPTQRTDSADKEVDNEGPKETARPQDSDAPQTKNQDAAVSSSGMESVRPTTDADGAEALPVEEDSKLDNRSPSKTVQSEGASAEDAESGPVVTESASETTSEKDRVIEKALSPSEADTIQSETQDSDRSSAIPASEALKAEDDDMMDEDFEDDPDLYDEESVVDEPVPAKLINPKFAANLKILNPGNTSSSKDGLSKPKTPMVVDLCDDDEEVTVIEPEISQVNLDDEDEAGQKSLLKSVLESGAKPAGTPLLSNGDPHINKSLSQLSAQTASGELTLTIASHSSVTLPAPGDFSSENNSSEGLANLGNEKDNSSEAVGPHSRDISSFSIFQDTMLEVIKEEQSRGYADEGVENEDDVEVPPVLRVPGTRREETERQMMDKDFTVDVDNMRCIICDHNFYSMLSLYRHTRCRTHLLNRSIIIKQRKGVAVDPKLLAENQRNLNVYKNQWFHGKRRQIGEPVSDRRKNFSCKICRLVFISQADLERHRQSKKHKLYALMGGPPPQEPIEKRKVIRPQHLQYEHEERIPTPSKAPAGSQSREYCCPIPNCGYICYDGSVLLTHMTSHGYPNQVPQVQQAGSPQVAPSPPPSRPSPSLPQPGAQNQPPAQGVATQPTRRKNYEGMYCHFHNAHFDTARGYLNHIRGCTIAPPISAFLKTADSSKGYCKLCDLDFSSHDMFLQHVKVYHKGSSLQQEQESGKQRVNAPVFVPRAIHPNKPSSRKHSCHICGKVFALMHSLHIHLKKHQQVTSSSNIRPTCRICKKSFLTRKACASHTKSHFLPPGSNKLFCSNCFKTFNSRPEISRHRFDGTCRPLAGASDSFSCDECDLSFKDKNVLNSHKLRFHPEVKKEVVDEDEEMLNVERLEAQELSQPEPSSSGVGMTPTEYEPKELRNCLLCEKSFETQEAMRKHCHMIHRMNDQKIDKMMVSFGYTIPPPPPPRVDTSRTCGRCKQSFMNRKQLQDHLMVCREGANFRNYCDQCQGQGCENCLPSTSQDLGSRGNDVNDLLFKCPIGQMSFNDEKAMLEHYSYCAGTCGPFFECGACGVEFRYRKSFDAHHCTTNRKRPSHECKTCKRTFSKRKYLEAHELKCTGQIPPTPSSSAQVPAYNSNSLKKTRRSGPIEGEEGSAPSELVMYSNPDVPIQTFSCEKCEKKFHSIKALNGHKWTHNETLPDNQMFCKFCGREELALSSLYQHIYKCVKSLFVTEEVMNCEDCNTFMSRYDTAKELATKLQSHILHCYPIPWYQNEGETESTEKFLCFYCCTAFSSAERLQIHKSQHHRKPKKRSSPFLYKSPRKRPRPHSSHPRIPPEAALYAAHQLEDEDDEDINDMIEEEVFEAADNVTSAGVSSVVTKFILNCSVCNREFHNIDKLRNHEKVHGIVRQVVNDDEPSGPNSSMLS
ncbi:unnamed protein product [Nesidiocoris tenuis]|uniref:C2H2-type domain-containing protein n=1 Tax=Nesidiocoris tenuis TaxID=355587 RepID=A0A6H5HEJ8_9HEMI|nr:unnamed protein product [Nesidiocoris tenuis]